MFCKLSQGKKTVVTEIHAMVKNKWNESQLEEKIKANVTLTRRKDRVSHGVEVCVGDLFHKINLPGQAFCAWCSEIIQLGSKGKIAHHFPRTSLCPRKSLIIWASNGAQFAHLSRTRTEIHPLQVCPVLGADPPNLVMKGELTL